MVQDKISRQKIKKYYNLTSKTLEIARKSVAKGGDKDAKEIIEMVSNYLSDAKHFQKKGDFVNCFAAINYAHGWLDAGARLGIFDVNDSRFFVVK